MRGFLAVAALLILAGCGSQMVDSGGHAGERKMVDANGESAIKASWA